MGRFIALEGSDGSGKTTQCNLFRQAILEKKMFGDVLSFPNYQSYAGRRIRRYLNGDFGTAHDVDPDLIAPLYALDRFLSKEKIENTVIWGEKDDLVIADRWTYSNMALIGARVKASGGDLEAFIQGVYRDEFVELRNPVPDMVIFLDLPPEGARKLLATRDGATAADPSGKLDVHEADNTIVENAYHIYKMLAERYQWKVVQCLDTEGNMRTPEDIHNEINQIIKGA